VTKSEKSILKAAYVRSRKIFDREVQKSKRQYWFQMQNNLLNECEMNHAEIRKSIGKIGVHYSGIKLIPEEVVLDDGSVSTSIQQVLNRWKSDFSSLFERRPHTNVNVDNSDLEGNVVDSSFNEIILLQDVKKAIFKSKMGKAYGVDGIPSEVLHNDAVIYFLHVLFNLCFDKKRYSFSMETHCHIGVYLLHRLCIKYIAGLLTLASVIGLKRIIFLLMSKTGLEEREEPLITYRLWWI